MNIVFMIGNGFDLNIGLKTSYRDFLKYYLTIDSPNEQIRKFKESINYNIELWSDLEAQLGKYTKELENAEDFESLFEDILKSIVNYLKNIENEIDISKLSNYADRVLNDFVNPEKYLLPADAKIINTFISTQKNDFRRVSIISFNYTNTIELILDKFKQENNSFIASKDGKGAGVKKILHIHGTLSGKTVLGVNDESQIDNNDFRSNIDLLEMLVKSEYNKLKKDLIDQDCLNEIQNASLIFIFGSSIGDTDNYWWEEIKKRLGKNNCKVIIFVKDQSILPNREYYLGRVERKYKKKLLRDGNETAEEIFISINSKIFDYFENGNITTAST